MKKLFTFFTLLTMAVSTSWASRTIYLNTAGSGWSSKTSFWVHVWGGSSTQDLNMSAVSGESNLFSVAINDDQNMIIFIPQSSIGTWTGQSSNISLDAEKDCYNYKDSKWETYPPTPEDNYTIYFKNTVDWSNVYVHFYGASYSMGTNGAGGNDAAANKGAMTKIGDGPYYQLDFTSSTAYTKVCFTKDEQNNYGNFWQTEASYSDAMDLTGSNVLYIPNKDSKETKNTNVPYYAGAWTTYPEPVETTYTVTLVNATESSVKAGELGVAITAGTAPSGQIFKEWVGTEGITFGNKDNASTTVFATKEGTATATFRDAETINLYFWNKDSWAEVAAYRWYGSATADSWPGVQLTTGVYKSDNHSIYKVTFTEGEYGKIIFNNNNNGQQTGDLDNLLSHNGQCYYGKNGGWNDLPEENWEVTISAENGSVESSKYVGATSKQVAATPDDDYVFDRWEATGGVTIVDGSSATATITANAAGTLTAYFKEDATKFSVNFTALNGSVTATVGGNSIQSGKQYTVGEPVDVQFTATPNDANYTFYGWYDLSNNKVSTENPFTATGINANYSIKAVYAGKYYLRHDWNQAGWDTKELTYDPTTALYYIYEYYGNTGFNYGSNPSSLSWNGSPSLVGSPAAKDWCYITTPGNGSITVTKVTESHNLAVVGANVTYTIQVNGQNATSALHMQSAVFAATAYDGFGFDGWYADALYENLLSSETSYEVTNIASDVTLYAKASAETQYTVTIANDVNSSTSSIQVGSAAKALAAPSINLYAFTNWTVEGDAVIADLNAANTTVTATGEATVTAHYALKHYYIKHTWGGSDWEWKEATQYEDGKFTLVAKYSEGCGCNWNDKADDEGKQWIENPTKVDNPQTGDVCEFTLDPVANTITITKMAGVEISINTTFEWATYFGNIALTVPDGAEAYYVQGINGDALDMVKISTIPANTGVLLYAEGGGDFTFNLTSTSDDYSDVNWLKGSVGDAVISNALTHYILSATSADNVGLYYPKGTGNNSGVGSFTNGAGKAYLEIPSSNPSVAARYLLRRPTMPTALDQVKEYAQDGKFIRNAQLIIVRDGHEYNAQGQLIK